MQSLRRLMSSRAVRTAGLFSAGTGLYLYNTHTARQQLKIFHRTLADIRAGNIQNPLNSAPEFSAAVQAFGGRISHDEMAEAVIVWIEQFGMNQDILILLDQLRPALNSQSQQKLTEWTEKAIHYRRYIRSPVIEMHLLKLLTALRFAETSPTPDDVSDFHDRLHTIMGAHLKSSSTDLRTLTLQYLGEIGAIVPAALKRLCAETAALNLLPLTSLPDSIKNPCLYDQVYGDTPEIQKAACDALKLLIPQMTLEECIALQKMLEQIKLAAKPGQSEITNHTHTLFGLCPRPIQRVNYFLEQSIQQKKWEASPEYALMPSPR